MYLDEHPINDKLGRDKKKPGQPHDGADPASNCPWRVAMVTSMSLGGIF